MSKLQKCGLVISSFEGNRVYYRANKAAVDEFIRMLSKKLRVKLILCSVRQRNQIIKNVIDFGFRIITVRFDFSRKVIKGRKLLFVFCGNRRQPRILIKERFQIRQNVIFILNCHFHLPLVCRFLLPCFANRGANRVPPAPKHVPKAHKHFKSCESTANMIK